jgi:drug/metabolite transporter (DMT)-like permease
MNSAVAVAIGHVYPTMVLLILAAQHRCAPAGGQVIAAFLGLVGVAATCLPGTVGSPPLVPVVMVVLSAVCNAAYVGVKLAPCLRRLAERHRSRTSSGA